MRKALLIFATINILLIHNDSAQKRGPISFSGWWVNTQYDYFKNQMKSENIVYSISPWYIYIDSSDKCTIVQLYEQKSEMGYPIEKKLSRGVFEVHYKKDYNVWLYNVKGNDSLIVYSTGITPGSGVIFKRYKGK